MTGAVDPQSLGVVLPHEHMLLDFRLAYTPPEYGVQKDLSNLSVELKNLGKIRHFPLVQCVCVV